METGQALLDQIKCCSTKLIEMWDQLIGELNKCGWGLDYKFTCMIINNYCTSYILLNINLSSLKLIEWIYDF